MAGLDGHAWESWTGRGKAGRMWLRDYFRQDFQNFRTMTYGYNSKLQAHNIDIIIDYCRGFLEEIRKVRRTKEVRIRLAGLFSARFDLIEGSLGAGERATVDLYWTRSRRNYHSTGKLVIISSIVC
jgi:hypothetical protein